MRIFRKRPMVASLLLIPLAVHRPVGAALLDEYPGAYAAFSLRSLSDTYRGPAIRVRRSSDNAEQDIGFDGTGFLDTAALTEFVGTGSGDDGYVVAWYDQTGGEPMVNSNAASQPYVVIGGQPVLSSTSKPGLYFVDSEDGAEGIATFLATTDRANPVQSTNYSLSLIVQRIGGTGEQEYAGIDGRGRPHEGSWYRGLHTYANGGSARLGGDGVGLVDALYTTITVRNSGNIAQLWQNHTLLQDKTSSEDPDLLREAAYDRVNVGCAFCNQAFSGIISEVVALDHYGSESWPVDYYVDSATDWNTGPTTWHETAVLPQSYPYQVTLYDWLETISAADAALPALRFSWDESLTDVDALADLWVLVGAITTSRVVRAEPGWYVLDAGNGKGIEATGVVRIWHEPGSEYGGNPARSWANEPAYLYQLSIPAADGAEGNPYYELPALGYRALVVAMADMMMYHQALDGGGYATWQDMYGKAFLSWAQTYAWTKELLPASVQRAFERGMEYFLDEMIDSGPRGANTNMDMFSLRGATEFYGATDDPALRAKCVSAVKRALFGYADGSLGTKHAVFAYNYLGIRKGVFDPSGFIMEGDQPDVFYGGESLNQLTGALASVTDRGTGAVDPAWSFLEEVVLLMCQWRHYQYFYDQGVAGPGSGGIKQRNYYQAGAGFSGRTGAGVPAGQAMDFWNSVFVADHFPELTFRASTTVYWPSESKMRDDITKALQARTAEMQSVYVGTPNEWNGWSPWVKEVPRLSRFGWYSRLRSLVDARDPIVLPLVARQGSSYNKGLGGPPTGLQYWAYKDGSGARDWGFFMEAQARQGGYGGWFGGKLETFWTKETGVVLLNRHGKSGCNAEDKEDSTCWDNLDYRAAHHVWGRDENGGGFTTLLLRGVDLERPVSFDLDGSAPTVTVKNVFNNPAHASKPTSSLTGEESGGEISGSVEITNTVVARSNGAYVTHLVASDGTDEVTELWASIPVFLKAYSPIQPGDQFQVDLPDTTIEYWNGSAWSQMPEDTSGDGVPEVVATRKLRLGRDFLLGDGPQYAYVVFDGEEHVRLSSQVYYDPYQTKTSVRTVHIDLHGSPGTVGPMPTSRSVSYLLGVSDASSADDGGLPTPSNLRLN